MVNKFLCFRSQIDESTKWLKDNGFINHPISAKDWELSNVVQLITDGDLVDLGADGSFVLHNAIKKGIKGRKVGIDLLEVTGTNKAEGAEYFVGDIQNTPFEDNSFDTVVSLSTIEHQVHFGKFAKEVSRLLRIGGNLFVSFDYWNPKPDTTKMQLYKLDWNILDEFDVLTLVTELNRYGLHLTDYIDWTTQDAVINPSYCSPAPVSYSFGLLNFIKK